GGEQGGQRGRDDDGETVPIHDAPPGALRPRGGARTITEARPSVLLDAAGHRTGRSRGSGGEDRVRRRERPATGPPALRAQAARPPRGRSGKARWPRSAAARRAWPRRRRGPVRQPGGGWWGGSTSASVWRRERNWVRSLPPCR